MKTYRQMLATAALMGLNVIPRHRQCQLLAVLHMYGNESFVFSEKLYEDTMFAASQLGFGAALVPQPAAIKAVKEYETEIRTAGRPAWFDDIEKIYQVTLPEWDDSWKECSDWKEQVNGRLRVSEGEHGKAGQR